MGAGVALVLLAGASAAAASDLEMRSHRGKRPTAPSGRTPVASGPPSVAFAGPTAGQRVRRRAIFRVRILNFSISPTPTPTRLVPGQGFLHFSMDGGTLDVPGHSANGAQAVRAGTQGRYSPVQGTSLRYINLPPGRHTLTVSLADNFHAEIGVSASMSFTVR